MNQQKEGSGCSTTSNVPTKRKRGRLREFVSVQGNNMPVMAGSASVLAWNQTPGTADGCDDEILRQMVVGKVVPAVIEGTFDGGCLVKILVADTYLRGTVLLPRRVVPVTAENDVAPDLPITERTDMPIPCPLTQIPSSVPSSGQCSKQPFEPELQVPMFVDQDHPAGLPSDISVSLENQSAPYCGTPD